MNRNRDYRIDENGEEFQALMTRVQGWDLEDGSGRRLDTGETATITRQLLYVKAKTYDIEYPAFRARDFIPVSHEVPTGAESWSYLQWDTFGMAKIIANYATDFPAVDAIVREFPQPVKSLGDHYKYTVQDLRRSAMAQQNGLAGATLDARRAKRAMEGMEQAIDDIAALGLPDAGFYGFINNPNVPVMALPTGLWAVSTALQIIADMNAMVARVTTQTKQIRMPNTMVMPVAEYQIITQTPFSTLGNHTIATWFATNNPYVKNIDQWTKLQSQNATGTGGRIVTYMRDPDVLTLEIPQEFEQFAPQLTGMEYRINCHARIGGCVWMYPFAAVYGDGSS